MLHVFLELIATYNFCWNCGQEFSYLCVCSYLIYFFFHCILKTLFSYSIHQEFYFFSQGEMVHQFYLESLNLKIISLEHLWSIDNRSHAYLLFLYQLCHIFDSPLNLIQEMNIVTCIISLSFSLSFYLSNRPQWPPIILIIGRWCSVPK